MSNALEYLVNGPEDMVVDHGSVSGTQQISYTEGMSHRLTLTGNTTIEFTDLISTAISELLLDLKDAGNYVITWPTNLKWIDTDGSHVTSLSAINITLKTDGTSDFVLIWTIDGGTTLFGKVLR